MKILSWNVGYFLGYNGSTLDYLKKPYRAILGCNQELEHGKIDEALNLIEEEEPDLVAFQEVDEGSIRTRTPGHTKKIRKDFSLRDYSCKSYNKYGNKANKIPLLRHLSNSVLFKHNWEVRPHYFSKGLKNLAIEVNIDESFSVFTVHLPLSSNMRREQLKELFYLTKRLNKVAIIGDFNLLGGLEEIEDLLTEFNLQARDPKKTIPEANLDRYIFNEPRYDLLIHSPNLDVSRYEQLPKRVSDHNALITEINP
ncbi:MAG: 5'-tyrosyl DNA phosphodiesterase, AP phosphodiesterase superfamily [Candidatus Methanohalarchaeum thermophilum]|uniref:5'-tyrosyl DNA phosphodiesterase, AP phosphodiesterase superfamily n=1 Tax=Methanohalarchaeum thermophilum TaxID=1903181 RepID=A0A1Q6DWW6_METT1|nr:MAG: 5'-tyrosyl DNA phosphodiesterase, AP phosphodiesterase superfamily [Candidatus Methanohalarchaeum thermophilum]